MERNLVHQMAATHALGMAMLAKAHAATVLAAPWVPEERQRMQSTEAARMATAARVFECSQRAALVLGRLRHGGQQNMTVQHITVGDGGQAVVASERPSPARRPAPARRANAGGAGAVPQGDVEARAPQRRGHRRAKAARPGAAARRRP
jgi:hypothetical protein